MCVATCQLGQRRGGALGMASVELAAIMGHRHACARAPLTSYITCSFLLLASFSFSKEIKTFANFKVGPYIVLLRQPHRSIGQKESFSFSGLEFRVPTRVIYNSNSIQLPLAEAKCRLQGT